jgi:glycosyltransferase involved in cell wall biosynthesis
MSEISVILTTYNGSEYIIPQLDSIKNQTLAPDEVLIFDDGSIDDTVYKINTFIKENKLSWKLSINPKQYGWRYNFIQGFSKSSGKYIFPCDQDDIWLESKIEIMYNSMINNHHISLLVSNYKIQFESSYRGRKHIPKFVNDSSIKILPIENIHRIQRPGCTFCFTRDFYLRVLPFWSESFAHDAWLWRCAIAEGGAYILNIPCIIFRRHGNNNSPVFKSSRIERIALYKEYNKIFLQLEKFSIYHGLIVASSFSDKLADFYLYRYNLLHHITAKRVFLLITNYKFYNSLREFLWDLKLAFLK